MDNRLSFEIKAMKIWEDEGLLSDTLEPLIGEGVGETTSPLGRPLTSTEWFYDWNESDPGFYDEGTWVYSNRVKSMEGVKTASYGVQLRLNSGFEAEDIDSQFFFYTLGIQFSNQMKKHRRLGEPAFYGSRIERGSTLLEFYAGAIAIGAAVSTYPKLKSGVFELISDARFLYRAISKALPNSVEESLLERKEPTISRPYQRFRQIPSAPEKDSEFRADMRKNRGGWNV